MKVPVMIQLQSMEGGSTVLGMVLAFYGKWLPADELRERCRISRGGVRPENLVDAARYYGMDADVASIEADGLAAEKTPFIMQWKKRQFAVVTSVKNGVVKMNDPKSGACSYPLESVAESFTGNIIRIKPGDGFEPGGKPKSAFSYIRQRASKATKAAPALVVVYSVGMVMNLLMLALTQVYLDNVIPGQHPEWFGPLIALMVACVAINFAAFSFQRIHLQRFSGRLAAQSGTELIKKLYRQPLRFFEQHFPGELMERVTVNEDIDRTILNTFLPLATDGVMLVAYILLMFYYNPAIAGALMLLEAVYIVINIAIQKKITDNARANKRVSGVVGTNSLNGLETIETIKSMGAECNFFRLWSFSQAELQKNQMDGMKLRKYLTAISSLHDTFSTVILLFLAAFFIMNSVLSLGMLAALQTILGIVRSKIWSFMDCYDTMQTMQVDIERINEITESDCGKEVELSDPDSADKLHGAIKVEDVSYSYLSGENPVLKHFSLDIAAGESIALVGPTGCGKSTVLKLIAGLYEPIDGSILYDGLPKPSIPDVVFHSSISAVDQETVLFEDSISENLRLWDSTIEDYEMILGATDAQIYKQITKRKGGFSGVVADNGNNFSGGERQRLEIARALAQEPTVLLFDEATSALDAITEEKIINAIRMRGITSIFVAHRLSTVRDCDRIVVLQNGEIAEVGSHAQLMEAHGLYRQLIEKQ